MRLSRSSIRRAACWCMAPTWVAMDSTLAAGVAVNAAGKLFVTGQTSSANFPLLNPFQGSPGGGIDAFVAE